MNTAANLMGWVRSLSVGRRIRFVVGFVVFVALTVLVSFVLDAVAPAIARKTLELFGHPGLGRPSDDEIARIALGLKWILLPLALLALAALAGRSIAVAIGAAGLTAYVAYLLGTIAAELNKMAVDEGWPTVAQAAYVSTLATLILGIVLMACLVLVALRGAWSTYAAALFATVAVGALWIGGTAVLREPFAEPEEVARGEIVVEAVVIGATLEPDQAVSVVFVIPKRNDAGTVSAVEQTTRGAVVVDSGTCDPENKSRCTVRLLVKRGDGDSSLGPWLADQAAASEIFVIGPTGVSPPAGRTNRLTVATDFRFAPLG